MNKLLQELKSPPMIAWASTTALVVLFSIVPAASINLDDNSGEFSDADDAINQINREQRLAKAGKAICGENSAWQIEGNTLQCFNKRGARTTTAQVTQP